MAHTLLGFLLVAHGLVTVAIWGPKYPAVADGQVQPPNPAHSWLFGDVRILSLALGVAVGIGLAAAGIGFLMHAGWWPAIAIGAGGASLLLFAVFFTPWWIVGIAISTGFIVAGLRAGGVT